MKNKMTAILLVAILANHNLASPALANEDQSKTEQTVQQTTQSNGAVLLQGTNPQTLHLGTVPREEESHPIRNILMGVAIAGVATVGLFGLMVIAVLDETGNRRCCR